MEVEFIFNLGFCLHVLRIQEHTYNINQSTNKKLIALLKLVILDVLKYFIKKVIIADCL